MNLPADIVRRLERRQRDRMAGCVGKVAFESRAMARQVSRRRAQRGKPSDVYKCRYCGRWHLGTRA